MLATSEDSRADMAEGSVRHGRCRRGLRTNLVRYWATGRKGRLSVWRGFIFIEARDMDEALHIAAGIPMAKHGSIEVRPEMNIG